jgi:hypothetical protein
MPSLARSATGHVPNLDGAFTIARIRREVATVPTPQLLEQADDLAHIPRLMRPLTWAWLGAVAIELGERAVHAEAALAGPSRPAGGAR